MISLGTSDSRDLRAPGGFHADKSLLIRDILALPDKVLRFTRPRRFGESAALSRLRAYFERSRSRSVLWPGAPAASRQDEVVDRRNGGQHRDAAA